KRIAAHVQHTLYYNPVQVPGTADPVAVLESHDARCGQGVTVTLALLAALGIPARRVDLCHHTVAEATYDGGEHVVDALFFGGSQPHRDGRVLSVAELQADPYFADAWPQACFAYDEELVTSDDGYWVLGYVFGVWGSEPYYSYYLGAPKDLPPTRPHWLPARREGPGRVRLHWSEALKAGSERVEYEVRVGGDRAGREVLLRTVTRERSLSFAVPEPERMYFVEVRAVDGHRVLNPETWYPPARGNFALVPEGQYGWYGVL
ncbi:MAG: transglutaminase domain-containing protein, partial [Gemmatimonadota bacterium]